MIGGIVAAKALPFVAAGALALAVGGFFFGRSTGRDACQADAVEALAKAQAALNKAHAAWGKRDAAAVVADTARVTEFREIVREIPTIIDRPVYRDRVCIDDDGLRVIGRGVAAANGAAASGADDEAAKVR